MLERALLRGVWVRTVRMTALAAAVALLQARSENHWHRSFSQHQGHLWQTAGAQTLSLCISRAEDAHRAEISARAWTGERNESLTDYFLIEIHNILGHQSSNFLPFVELLEIQQTLQLRYVTF